MDRICPFVKRAGSFVQRCSTGRPEQNICHLSTPSPDIGIPTSAPPQPMYTTINIETDIYMDSVSVRMVQKKGLWSKKKARGPKKRGLVQKIWLWSNKYFDGPKTYWDDIHISLLLFTLKYFGPKHISTLRFFFWKLFFIFRNIYFQIFIFQKFYIYKILDL